MTARYPKQAILYVEALGFLILIAITWLDEGILVPTHMLPAWLGDGNWHDALFISLAIILIAFTVLLLTFKLISRIHELESFIRVCAWCRKLDLNGQWVTMEEYLSKSSHIECTHGVCRSCAGNLKREAEATRRLHPLIETN